MPSMTRSGRNLQVRSGALALAVLAAAGPLRAGLQSGAVREVQVRMSIGADAPEGPAFVHFQPEFARTAVRTQRTVPGRLPRQRRPELSEDLLVIAAFDVRGDEIYRTSLPDPRLLRAETADGSGRLASTRIYRESVDFWITLPDGPDLDHVVFSHPEWTGTVFNLVPVGEIKLR